ncbi:hypothetical protein ABW20_dc0103649 [Dactylellina cionopaga]|nr:hypothetical protein ABW20_dc0103649 [Dactylellina cionopaga]
MKVSMVMVRAVVCVPIPKTNVGVIVAIVRRLLNGGEVLTVQEHSVMPAVCITLNKLES